MSARVSHQTRSPMVKRTWEYPEALSQWHLEHEGWPKVKVMLSLCDRNAHLNVENSTERVAHVEIRELITSRINKK